MERKFRAKNITVMMYVVLSRNHVFFGTLTIDVFML